MSRTAVKFAFTITVAVVFAACGADRQIGSVAEVEVAAGAININTAGIDELQRIPNVGEKLAAEIVEFRQQHGPFRRSEHLLLINGISDRRFREIRHLVRVE